MDAYPLEYVEHNIPLILLLGLDSQAEPERTASEASLLQDGGFVIKSDLPPVRGEHGQQLLQALHRYDGSSRPWHMRATNEQGGFFGFRVRSTGRVRRPEKLS